MIVPFPAGGGTDAIARVVAGKLSDIWGQQVVVENRGGGATNIGTEMVVRSDPDGYTVLITSMPLAVNRFLFSHAQLRSSRGSRPGIADLRVPQHHGGADHFARPLGDGLHRLCEGPQCQRDLRILRSRHLCSPLWRAVQAHGRNRDVARAVSLPSTICCRDGWT
jgi:Tripartite tricarboxylate transporter family receptor